MSIRHDIVKALTRSQKTADVVPFPKPAGAKPKKRVKKPKVYKRILDDGNEHYSPNGDRFKKETIGGVPHMRREDGALFKLRRDGKWVFVSERRAGGRRKKGGSVLPYVIGGGAVGAGGAALANRMMQDDD